MEKIGAALSKANKILRMLSSTFESREIGIWKQLYKQIIRSY